MVDYPALHALAAVARTGGFERAAAELGVTQSAISQRIKSLEDKIGAVLIRRVQPCAPTELGQRLVRHVEDVGLLEHLLSQDLGGLLPQDAAARVRIAVNADSLATWFLPALADIDGLLFDLVVDDQDHSANWLQQGQVAAAVTASTGPVQGCDSHSLGALGYVATASPRFAARWFPNGVTAEALKIAPALTFDPKDRLQADWVRAVVGKPCSFPTHLIPSSEGFVEAALMGLGWGMNPELLVADHLKAGRLIAILPEAPAKTPLFWQVSRIARRALDPLTRAVRAAARRSLMAGG